MRALPNTPVGPAGLPALVAATIWFTYEWPVCDEHAYDLLAAAGVAAVAHLDILRMRLAEPLVVLNPSPRSGDMVVVVVVVKSGGRWFTYMLH